MQARVRRGVLAAGVALVPLSAQATDGPPRDPGIQILVPFAQTLSMALPHPAGERGLATVVVQGGRVHAGTPDTPVTLAAFGSADELWQGEIGLLVMDIDFDGYPDLGVLDGVGYGGVNLFYRFWLADAQAHYVPVGLVSNPEADPASRTVRAASRSGPIWTSEVHRVEGGALRLLYAREHRGDHDRVTFPGARKGEAVTAIIPVVAADPPDAASLDDPAYHQTALALRPRVHFHDAPDAATRREAFLVEGDVARVLEMAPDDSFMRITFTHGPTGRVTEGWVKVEEMAFVQG